MQKSHLYHEECLENHEKLTMRTNYVYDRQQKGAEEQWALSMGVTFDLSYGKGEYLLGKSM
jgi:hypothetical protein